MVQKTVPTEPFPYNYKIWDTVTGGYVYNSTDLDELYFEYLANYSEWIKRRVPILRRYVMDTALPNYRWENEYRRYQIHNHFGEDISKDIHEEYRTYRYYGYRFDDLSKPDDIFYKKGNPNKIKRGYGYGRWYKNRHEFYESDFVTGYWYRRIATFPERKINSAHADEYGETVVRPRRRNLPSNWDDPGNSAARTARSWKHNSKRKHQYKIKK